MTNSNLMIKGLVTEDTSSIVLGLDKGLLLKEVPRQQGLQKFESNSFLNGSVSGNT